MRAWFEGRTRREQVLLTVLAVALAAFLLWFGLYRPLAQARADAERRLDRAAATAAEVDRATVRLRAMGAAARVRPAAADPAQAVNAAASAAGLALARVEPDPSGGVQVAVAGVSPSQLFPWLAALQTDYGVTPRHLTVIKDEQGTLSVDATFGGAD
ncbi:type II secretion system protein GspM [Phenylobacterium sp.]|uniref:type II secretion system protein GspM n=1 Tax=Phenylobacterium sp. TaxID=1871053 RepID=UPI002D079596|nr:type II secretion system protein GspM [Phenylobacterium sp.]HVI34457.1 type II secretion system protein GspM [Phenylobacterium sp.]